MCSTPFYNQLSFPISRGAAGSGRLPEYETRLGPLLAVDDEGMGDGDADGGIAACNSKPIMFMNVRPFSTT